MACPQQLYHLLSYGCQSCTHQVELSDCVSVSRSAALGLKQCLSAFKTDGLPSEHGTRFSKHKTSIYDRLICALVQAIQAIVLLV